VLAGLGAFFWGWTGFIAGLMIWACIEILAVMVLIEDIKYTKKKLAERGINWNDLK
jgi:hypothetical protein